MREDYMKSLNISANALLVALKTPASRINNIVLEQESSTFDTAMRVVRSLGADVRSWLNPKIAYVLNIAERLLSKKVFANVQATAA